jgi:hypothetical protein
MVVKSALAGAKNWNGRLAEIKTETTNGRQM